MIRLDALPGERRLSRGFLVDLLQHVVDERRVDHPDRKLPELRKDVLLQEALALPERRLGPGVLALLLTLDPVLGEGPERRFASPRPALTLLGLALVRRVDALPRELEGLIGRSCGPP